MLRWLNTPSWNGLGGRNGHTGLYVLTCLWGFIINRLGTWLDTKCPSLHVQNKATNRLQMCVSWYVLECFPKFLYPVPTHVASEFLPTQDSR